MTQLWDPELDTRPWHEVLAWQRAQLPGYLTDLRRRSGFYADRLPEAAVADATEDDAWHQIPFLTKNDIRANQRERAEDLLLGTLQSVPNDRIVQVVGSSGTTGNPTFYGLTARDLQRWTDSLTNWITTAGVGPGNVVALTTGMPMVAGGMPYADAIRAAGATLAWVGGQTTERMCRQLELLRVDTLMGTASFVSFFSERCEQELGYPARDLPIRQILAGGEPGMAQPEARRRVLDAWGAGRLSEVMGLCDVLAGIWSQCGAGAGMHFTAARDVHVELIDPGTGEPVAWDDGALGEAVYTHLNREATPVVRYRSRDHMRVVGTSCACGRMSPRVECVGRTDDMLIYKAMNVFPGDIRDVVMDRFADRIAGPMRLRKDHADQVRFDAPIPLEVEIADLGDGALAAEIEEHVRTALRVRVAVEALEPGSIPLGMMKNALTYVRN
ncbi:phenylacetate--CoA ligase family protein [Georgenia deserti]|uniref:Phenylacetate--CoA ligase family protein n=1 Tax=Georgenia deserti TaxID=2093781 RepID=A0ABW4L3H9_9MICO